MKALWARVMGRHHPNPRYCHAHRCIRLANHVGMHMDDVGRSWS